MARKKTVSRTTAFIIGALLFIVGMAFKDKYSIRVFWDKDLVNPFKKTV